MLIEKLLIKIFINYSLVSQCCMFEINSYSQLMIHYSKIFGFYHLEVMFMTFVIMSWYLRLVTM